MIYYIIFSYIAILGSFDIADKKYIKRAIIVWILSPFTLPILIGTALAKIAQK